MPNLKPPRQEFGPVHPESGPGHPSFWHATALEGEEADVVVLGAGICGVSAALTVRELKPDWSLLVLDPWGVACGASGRNAGFLLSGLAENHAASARVHGREKARRLREFTVASIERLVGMAERFRLRGWGRRSGAWVVADTPEESEELRESAAMIAEDGIEGVEWHERTPFGRGFFGALRNPRDHEVHPVRLLRGLARGGRLRVERARAESLEPLGGGAFRVETDQGALLCRRRLLVCANAYLPRLMPDAAERVRPVRGQVLVTDPIPERLFEGVAHSNNCYDYFRQLDDGGVLFGGRRHLRAEEEVGYALDPTEPVQRSLEAFLRERFEEIDRARLGEPGGLKVRHRWCGTMGFSPTSLPFIDATADGAFLAGGFTGMGMGLGCGAGTALARLALRGEREELFALAQSGERSAQA